MALIKCPECEKQMSDKAEKCPHCGYAPEKKTVVENSSNAVKNLKGKWNNKYLLIILVVLVAGYFLFFNNPSSNTGGTGGGTGGGNEPSNNQPSNNQPSGLTPNANGNYEFNQNGKYFEFPTNYKVYVEKDGTIYVGKNIDNNGALIPYIMIEKYKGYTDPTVLMSEVTTEIGKAYSDAVITINLISNYIGDKYVYGMQFRYTSSGHVVNDNRYAFLVNGHMYLVTTKEENVNTTEINNVARIIMETLKEVN